MENGLKEYRKIIVVGSTKTGKSTFVKDKLLGKWKGKRLLYDPQREYKGGLQIEMEAFFNLACEVKDHFILFEEATVFFSNKGDEKPMRQLLIDVRHKNNVLVFCFHSLQQVPLNILSNCDVLVLKKTGDNIELVRKKFGKQGNIYRVFLMLKKIPTRWWSILIKLQ